MDEEDGGVCRRGGGGGGGGGGGAGFVGREGERGERCGVAGGCAGPGEGFEAAGLEGGLGRHFWREVWGFLFVGGFFLRGIGGLDGGSFVLDFVQGRIWGNERL